MIEETILTYLSGALDVPVLMELPEVPSEDYPVFPDRMVLIERVGTKMTNHVVIASFAFQSYSCSRLYDAASLDEEVREALEDLPELPEIGSVHLESNYNFTDTRTKRYRYQSVYEIRYIG